MKHFLSVALVFFSTLSFAGETRLDVARFVDQMDHKYEKMGQDNNGLDVAGELQLDPFLNRVTPIKSRHALEDTLKDCVFIREGAWGEHINEGQQAKLAHKFGKRLWIHRDKLSFSRVSNIDLGSIVNNNCVLSIKHDGTYTVVQGGADS